MADILWLVIAAVAIVALVSTIHFGIQSLRTVIMRCEWAAGYANGRIEVKLENLEQLLRRVRRELARRN